MLEQINTDVNESITHLFGTVLEINYSRIKYKNDLLHFNYIIFAVERTAESRYLRHSLSSPEIKTLRAPLTYAKCAHRLCLGKKKQRKITVVIIIQLYNCSARRFHWETCVGRPRERVINNRTL